MDFVEDMIRSMKDNLHGAGIRYDKKDDAFNFLTKYIGVLERLIRPGVRRVHTSESVMARLGSATQAVCNAFEEISRRTQTGDDLRPFLSKAVRNANYNDDLLNDWGIHRNKFYISYLNNIHEH